MPLRILIVEDEPLIAMMLEDFLSLLGGAPLRPVDSCADALDLIAQGGIDAAILDINLRDGETSAPVAEALAAADIPFLFTSGGSNMQILEAHRDRPVLAKPFTMDAVARAIESIA